VGLFFIFVGRFLMVVLFFVSLVVASLVSSVGFVGFVSGLLSFALLCGVLSVVCFGIGFAVFGARSFSGELAGESVEFGPVAVPAVARSVACSAAAVEVLVVELPASVPVGRVLACGFVGECPLFAECAVFQGVASSPSSLARAGCPRLVSGSGRALGGAALAGRVRSLARAGRFVVS
jgi:hypothetical protein